MEQLVTLPNTIQRKIISYIVQSKQCVFWEKAQLSMVNWYYHDMVLQLINEIKGSAIHAIYINIRNLRELYSHFTSKYSLTRNLILIWDPSYDKQQSDLPLLIADTTIVELIKVSLIGISVIGWDHRSNQYLETILKLSGDNLQMLSIDMGYGNPATFTSSVGNGVKYLSYNLFVSNLAFAIAPIPKKSLKILTVTLGRDKNSISLFAKQCMSSLMNRVVELELNLAPSSDDVWISNGQNLVDLIQVKLPTYFKGLRKLKIDTVDYVKEYNQPEVYSQLVQYLKATPTISSISFGYLPPHIINEISNISSIRKLRLYGCKTLDTGAYTFNLDKLTIHNDPESDHEIRVNNQSTIKKIKIKDEEELPSFMYDYIEQNTSLMELKGIPYSDRVGASIAKSKSLERIELLLYEQDQYTQPIVLKQISECTTLETVIIENYQSKPNRAEEIGKITYGFKLIYIDTNYFYRHGYKRI